jgi:diguanylate cyclase (GGDEF)-like protein
MRAEQLGEHAKQSHLKVEGNTLEATTLSIGAAVFPEYGATSAAILSAVDAAIYRAKLEGHGRVVMAS